MRIKDIVNLTQEDVTLLSKNPEKLLDITKQAFRYAKSRRTSSRNYLEKMGIDTSQLIYRQDSPYIDYNFNANRLSLDMDFGHYTNVTNLLLHELKIAKDYLSSETSTGRGWLNVLKKFSKRVEDITAIHISNEDYDLLWRIYNKVVSNAGAVENLSYNSTQLQKMIYDTMSDQSLLQSLGLNSSSDRSEILDVISDYLIEKDKDIYINEMEREQKELEKYSEGITIKGRGRRR